MRTGRRGVVLCVAFVTGLRSDADIRGLLPSTPRTLSLRSPHPPSQKFPFLLAQRQHVPPLALAHLRLPVTAQALVG